MGKINYAIFLQDCTEYGPTFLKGSIHPIEDRGHSYIGVSSGIPEDTWNFGEDLIREVTPLELIKYLRSKKEKL